MEIYTSPLHFGVLKRPRKMILLLVKILALDFDAVFKAYLIIL